MRAQSWPLINVPVLQVAVSEGDKLDEQAHQQINCIPGTRQPDMCCQFQCPLAAQTNTICRCCCELAHRANTSASTNKTPAKQKKKDSFWPALFHGRNRSSGYALDRKKCVTTGARNLNGTIVNLNGGANLEPKQTTITTTTKNGASENEKKAVTTTSPTFQQLIMTRRLLCRHYYPEGGWGVVIVIVAVLVQIVAHGLHLSVGVLLLPTSRRFHTRWYHTSE